MSIKRYNKFLILLCFAFNITQLQATTIFVKSDAAGAENGTSWSDAFTELQDAINAAVGGDEIWVAAATYYPTTDPVGNPNPFSNREKTFFLDKNIKIHGGFAGTETLLSERNPALHPTILSGDLDMDGTLAGDNAYHVIIIENTGTDITNDLLLDGLTITLGKATAGEEASTGGGILINGVESVCSPSLNNCIITQNKAMGGGGIFCIGIFNGEANPSITNCLFSDNEANFGGAIINEGGDNGNCNPSINNTQFINNSAEVEGGAVYNSGMYDGTCEPSFDNCYFEGNTADYGGGAVYSSGAFGECAPTFINTTFHDNNAILAGGAVFHDAYDGFCAAVYEDCVFSDNVAGEGNEDEGDGGAVYSFAAMGFCFTIFDSSEFTNNFSDNDGGAIYNDSEDGEIYAVLQQCTFTNNMANDDGGCLYNLSDNGTLDLFAPECIFDQNSATENGGVLYHDGDSGLGIGLFFNNLFSNNSAGEIGSVFGIDDGETPGVSLVNCTFTGNSSPSSAAIAYTFWDSDMISPIVDNCIFWNNDATFAQTPGGDGELTISNSLIQETTCPTGATCNSILLDQDPRFTNPMDNDYTLAACSPALNIGENSSNPAPVDLANNPRVNETTIDLGAYEFQGIAGSADVTPPIVECQDITIALDETGNYELTALDIATITGSIYDDCSDESALVVELSATSFDCSIISPIVGITVSVTDESGNTEICLATITVEEGLFPNEVIYVDANGAGGNGRDWDHALTNLRDALDLAQTCPDRFNEIWVAAGVYYPDEGSNVTDNDRDAYFELMEGVSLLGGFAGTETSASERDSEVNQTILSGDIEQNDTDQPIVEDTDNIVGQNSYTVVKVPANVTDQTTLSGFSITAGMSDGNILSPILERSGAGIFNEGSIQLDDLKLLGNKANTGGGLYNNGLNGMVASPIINCTFEDNYAVSGGGALYNDGRGSGVCMPTITNAMFLKNESLSTGGAVYNNGALGGDCSPSFINCTFSQNSAINGGSSMYNYYATPFIYNSIFYADAISGNNQLITDNNSTVTISNSTVEGNYQNQSNANPNFIVPPSANTPEENWDFSLGANSPDIDAADIQYLPAYVVKDLAGNPRVYNGTLDKGAYEFQSAALPIELTVFEATLTDESEVSLNWITKNELNSSHFVVEKSRDGIHFEPIAQQTAAGTTTQTQVYQHIDQTPYKGINYYRLQQVDLDGTFDYSVIRAVRLNTGQVNLYPNPARDYVTITLSDFEQSMVAIKVTNIAGQILYDGNIAISNEQAVIQLEEVHAYVPGTYFIEIQATNQPIIHKQFIKIK